MSWFALNIQTAKSAIHRAEEARREIEGITPTLQAVQRKYVEAVKTALEVEGYISSPELEKLLTVQPDETPIEILRDTYKDYFIDAGPYAFDKTLFHFLIRRLGKAKDRFAVEHCKTLLERQPQETAYLLEYFAAVGAVDELQETLALFVNSKEAVYSYQIYQIFDWAFSEVKAPTDGLIACARLRAFSGEAPPYLRSVCRQFLAKFGSTSDLERLERAYAGAGSDLERAEIMCCLARMERGRRNAFIARAESDGEWARRAAKWVKQQMQKADS